MFSNSALRFMKLWDLIVTVSTTSYGVSFIYALERGKERRFGLQILYMMYLTFGTGNRSFFHKVFLIEYEMFLIWHGI